MQVFVHDLFIRFCLLGELKPLVINSFWTDFLFFFHKENSAEN